MWPFCAGGCGNRIIRRNAHVRAKGSRAEKTIGKAFQWVKVVQTVEDEEDYPRQRAEIALQVLL